MRPEKLKTKIFLDGGDPNETKQIIKLLGFLDGQTTNPSLIAKNPQVVKRIKKGDTFAIDELLQFYKKLVQKIATLIPQGSISIEVFANEKTTAQEMITQGKDMYTWIPNAHIKYPTNKAGLIAAEKTIKTGGRVNMTLCFSQEQAAAVYGATKSEKYETTLKGFKNVFLSPFVGRLDDRGINGMSFIKNVVNMYKQSDHHVEVLTASVRNLDHFLCAIALGSDIITAPFTVLKDWKESGMKLPKKNFVYDKKQLKDIPYKKFDLEKYWRKFDINHELTDAGIKKFSADENTLLH